MKTSEAKLLLSENFRGIFGPKKTFVLPVLLSEKTSMPFKGNNNNDDDDDDDDELLL